MRRYTIMLAAVFLLPAAARADTIVLKNGNSLSGIIRSEDEEAVELEIGIGTVKFERREIRDIDRSTTPVEAQRMRKQWKEEQRQEEYTRIRLKEQERERKAAEPVIREEKVKVDSDTGHIVTPVLINGKVKANLIVDTGASLVVLSKQLAQRLADSGVTLRRPRTKQVDLTLGDGRKLKADLVILDSLRIEDSVAENIEAAIMPEEQSKMGYDGVLGMSFLSKFNFGFKQKEGKLTLEKLK